MIDNQRPGQNSVDPLIIFPPGPCTGPGCPGWGRGPWGPGWGPCVGPGCRGWGPGPWRGPGWGPGRGPCRGPGCRGGRW